MYECENLNIRPENDIYVSITQLNILPDLIFLIHLLLIKNIIWWINTLSNENSNFLLMRKWKIRTTNLLIAVADTYYLIHII